MCIVCCFRDVTGYLVKICNFVGLKCMMILVEISPRKHQSYGKRCNLHLAILTEIMRDEKQTHKLTFASCLAANMAYTSNFWIRLRQREQNKTADISLEVNLNVCSYDRMLDNSNLTISHVVWNYCRRPNKETSTVTVTSCLSIKAFIID